MELRRLTKLSAREARLYAEVCDMYADGDDHPELWVRDDGELFMKCKEGVFTIYHGLNKLEEKND